MDFPVTARSGTDVSSGARGIQSLWPRHPLPLPKPAVTQISQMCCRQKKVFQDPGITDTDPEILGLAEQ